MNENWEELISLCVKRDISIELVALPHLHRHKSSAIKRAAVLRELRRKGWSPAEIHRVCPITRISLRKILGMQPKARRHHHKSNATPGDRRARHCRLVYPSDYEVHRVRARQLAPKHHPIYGVWSGILQRCYDKDNPGYRWYGAKKIRVCFRWLNFSKFADDVGRRPLRAWLIRTDNSGHYTPGNCRWSATKGRPAKVTRINKRFHLSP